MNKWILILSVIACTQMVLGADDLDLGFNPEDVWDDLGLPEDLDFNERYSDAAQGAQPQATLNQLPYLIGAQEGLQTEFNEAFASAPLDMQEIAEAGANLAGTLPVMMRAPLPDQTAVQEDIGEEKNVESAQAAQTAIPDATIAQEAIPPTAITQATQAAATQAKPKKKKTQEYSCYICHKVFSGLPTLNTHIRVHTGEKPYKCDQCDKAFAQKGNLTVHKQIHTGENLFACSECSKSFSRKSVLNKHKKVHTGESFQCDWEDCGKLLSHKSALDVHKRIHTGKKPYACSICGKTFTHKSSCTRHEATHKNKWS